VAISALEHVYVAGWSSASASPVTSPPWLSWYFRSL